MKRTSIQATKIKDYNVQIYDFQILVFLLNLFSEILTLKLSSPVLGEKKNKTKKHLLLRSSAAAGGDSERCCCCFGAKRKLS